MNAEAQRRRGAKNAEEIRIRGRSAPERVQDAVLAPDDDAAGNDGG